jgi:hypothetical protein
MKVLGIFVLSEICCEVSLMRNSDYEKDKQRI